MDYDPESDSYICRHGKQLTAVSKRTQKTATGYQREVTIYECESCNDFPYKKDCIKGNNCKTAFEDRNKRLSVSRKMEEKRAECLERITSDYGTQPENEPQYSGGRILRKCERRHELQKISVSWKRKCSCTEHTPGNRL